MSFVGDIVGDITGANKVAEQAERSASDLLEAQRRAEALSEKRYGEATEMLDPYIMGGRQAYEQYLAQLGMAPEGVTAIDPTQTAAFKTQMAQTMENIEEGAAGQGMLHSGTFMQDVATGTQNLYQNYLNQLMGLGGSGMSAASNLGSLGVGQAANLGSQMLGAQQQAGQMRIGGASVLPQVMGDVMGSAAMAYGMA